MKQLKDLYMKVLEEGELVSSRSGDVINLVDARLEFDLSKGFPVTTSKKLAWQATVGELLWFLSGSTDLRELKHYTFNDSMTDKWTIWTDDFARYNNNLEYPFNMYGGDIYGQQYRNYNGEGIDQVESLITNIKNNPTSRRLIVCAWNPVAVELEKGCLPPCHYLYQVVIFKGKLHLKVHLRSNDLFLGLPVNIASYALLTHLLAEWTGYPVGKLIMNITNPHIYLNHTEQVEEYINNKEHALPELVLPERAKISLDETLKLTAKDFKDSLVNYQNEGPIKAPLSVG